MRSDEARARFAHARVARLATANARGVPHVVPIVFALAGECVYSVVDAKPKRSASLRRLANVRENPCVSVLVDHYDEDWEALWWARADGRGRVLDPGGRRAGVDQAEGLQDGADRAGGDEARRAAQLLHERYPQQRAVGAVLAIDVERWTGWSARGG